MQDTIEKPHRLSGGETPLTPEMQRVRELIEAEPDVHRLLALTELPNGRFAYLIQTPFATFPKFAVGITDTENADPDVLLQCGAQWSGENFFDNLINQ